MSNNKNIKAVAVGDREAGKTCLIIRYATAKYVEEYVPKATDSYSLQVTDTLSGEEYIIGLWDTSMAPTEYDRLRPLWYMGTNVFLVCFSLDSANALGNIQHKWVPEIQHFCPDTPFILVGCKSDLRGCRTIDEKDIKKVAKHFKCEYILVSALTGHGIAELFSHVVSLGAWSIHCTLNRRSFSKWKKKAPERPKLPPVKSTIAPALCIKIAKSTFSEDMANLLKDSSHADVVFKLDGKTFVHAHKIILCASSSSFRKVFGVTWPDKQRNEVPHQTFANTQQKSGSPSETLSLCVLCDEVEETTGKKRTVIKMADDIESPAFIMALRFLYTGTLQTDESTTENNLEEQRKLSQLFSVPDLQHWCNIEQKEKSQESSNTFKQRMKNLFDKRHVLSDVKFLVEGKSIQAHKTILTARSEMLSAMLGQNFKEGQMNSNTPIDIPDIGYREFLVFLEYLYTDHAPLDKCQVLELLKLADRFRQLRLLSLCELQLAEEMDEECDRKRVGIEKEVFGLVQVAQTFNAEQLSSWCLELISANYEDFSTKEGFSELGAENLKLVKRIHLPYLHDNELSKARQKCSITCCF